MRKFDLIIFGATGFTGRYVVERLAQTVDRYGLGTRWAIAVRNRTKMQQYLQAIERNTGVTDLRQKVTLLEADVADDESMRRAFGQGRLVMNCIGPYSLLGEPVLRACVDAKSHYMDLSGEPLFLELMQLRYHQAAQANQVWAVGSCGFDSIPSDIGTQYLKGRFPGHLNQVDHSLEVYYNKKNNFSYATWLSLIEGYKHVAELKRIRQKLFAPEAQFFKPFKWNVVQKRQAFSKSPRGYLVPFPGSDRSVVKRTQLFRHTLFNESPTQMEAYFCIPTMSELLKRAFMNYQLAVLTRWDWTSKILRENGDFFSWGMFRKGKTPDRALLPESSFRLTLVGRGWSRDIPEANRTRENMNRTSAVILSGGDGAYTETATIAIQTALVLLEQIDKLKQNQLPPQPNTFGVITPGTIIDPEALFSRLVKEGIRIEFIEDYRG